jgi:hypothetical protein
VAWGGRNARRWGSTSSTGSRQNLTLDATINPDFGQVEADPGVLNLTAFEVRFDERRSVLPGRRRLCSGASLARGFFYPRRIGRTPQLRANGDDPLFTHDSPVPQSSPAVSPAASTWESSTVR